MDENNNSNSSDTSSLVDARDEEGWEDAEDDAEDVRIVSLLDDATFRDVSGMLQHCKTTYDFDFIQLIQKFDLDFYGKIKLVNYIRTYVKESKKRPEIASEKDFADDKYLQPVHEDDALLFLLDEISAPEPHTSEKIPNGDGPIQSQAKRIQDLESQLSKLQSQFSDYRFTVERTLDERWNSSTAEASSSATAPTQAANSSKSNDEGYFESYSYNTIHQTMLQDRVRTDAYRDFIYHNKPLFTNKTVLDIGCGTGILSLFCARAGAKHVYAVDNSAIIDKARGIIFANGLQDRITCLRGKVEEVKLPVEKVDIIVSEWMGYCLLYEGMLDSVLWARDRYLAREGLVVPSHCSLRVAPVADPEWVGENVTFWNDVYGFDMRAMMDKVNEDVVVRRVKPEAIAGASSVFKWLDLKTVKIEELVFEGKFDTVLDKDVDALDGWLVWFDTFFTTAFNTQVPAYTKAEEWKDRVDGNVAFTTGPFDKETHWQSGSMTIDRLQSQGQPLKKGQQIVGSVAFRRREESKRELDIEIEWDAQGTDEKGSQVFVLR
ncbi:MAG: hypothetical protein M1820_003593 [Bogoriella megaspora]|nr:MAG: hypothetical protein M1820_003593 [Bogoriella megaspora]